MTQERTDAPTPAGGDYSVAVYVRMPGLVEVEKSQANGIVITEFKADGTFVMETVAGFTPGPDDETDEEFFARLGIPEDTSEDSTVIFVGPRGIAAARKTVGNTDDGSAL